MKNRLQITSSRLRWSILLAGLLIVLLGGVALALPSSTNYAIPGMTVSGTGGSGSSTNYKTVYNVGQVATGSGTSTNYQASLGFWASGNIVDVSYPLHHVYLPMVVKN
jgi:hypothetical protein